MALLSVPVRISQEPQDEPGRPSSLWVHRMEKQAGSLATEALSVPASSFSLRSNYAFASWTVRSSLLVTLMADYREAATQGWHACFTGMLCKGLWSYEQEVTAAERVGSTLSYQGPRAGGFSWPTSQPGIHLVCFWPGISSLCCYPRICPMTFSTEVGPEGGSLPTKTLTPRSGNNYQLPWPCRLRWMEPTALSKHFLIFLHTGSFLISFLWVILTHPSEPRGCLFPHSSARPGSLIPGNWAAVRGVSPSPHLVLWQHEGCLLRFQFLKDRNQACFCCMHRIVSA